MAYSECKVRRIPRSTAPLVLCSSPQPMPPTVRPMPQVYRKSDGVLMARGSHVKHVG